VFYCSRLFTFVNFLGGATSKLIGAAQNWLPQEQHVQTISCSRIVCSFNSLCQFCPYFWNLDIFNTGAHFDIVLWREIWKYCFTV